MQLVCVRMKSCCGITCEVISSIWISMPISSRRYSATFDYQRRRKDEAFEEAELPEVGDVTIFSALKSAAPRPQVGGTGSHVTQCVVFFSCSLEYAAASVAALFRENRARSRSVTHAAGSLNVIFITSCPANDNRSSLF